MANALMALAAGLAAVLIACTAQPAAARGMARVLYVDRSSRDCSDKGQGSATRPFCTIMRAAVRVRPGQTVRVAGGDYSEIVSVQVSGTAKAPIVFTAAPGQVVTLSRNTSGFRLWRKRWVTVNGFTVSNTRSYGISVQNSSHIAITNNVVTSTGRQRKGQARSGISFSNVTDSTLAGNSVAYATAYGINLLGSMRILVRGNISFHNAFVWQRAASGIRLFGSTASTVVGNIANDNEDSGIEFDNSPGNSVQDNLSFDNTDHGIDIYKSPGMRISRNTVYDNLTAGINVEGGSTGAIISSNVGVDNAIGGPRNHSNIRVETGSTEGTTMDSDDVYLRNPDVLLIWDNVNYFTLASFQAATGQESHGLESEPHWVDCTLPGSSSTGRLQTFKTASDASCAFLRTVRQRSA